VKGFVLAAGLGERLRPITESLPKPLMPVGNLPLVGYALRLLAHHGITEVVVNLHHQAKVLRDALGDGSRFGVSLTFSHEEEILGTGGALKYAHELLEDDTFVVVNSDTVLDVDLQAVIAAHAARGALATMVLRADPKQHEYGQIEIDAAGRVRRILGQGAAEGERRSLMFAGVHVIEPRFLEYIPPDVNTCIMRYAYMKALQNDEMLGGEVMDGSWCDAGTPARYFQAQVDAMSQKMVLRHADPLGGYALEPKRAVAEVVRLGKNVDLGPSARIVPPVLLGDGVKVGEGATVGPYVCVGARAQIGKEAQVSESVLLEQAKVDGGTLLRRAIVGRKATLAIDPDVIPAPSAP